MQKKFAESKNHFMFFMLFFLCSTLLVAGCGKEDHKASGQGEQTMDTDVVVVGSGATGLTAAIQARQLGLHVIVLEKNAWVGGTSAITEGYGGINSNFAEQKGFHYNVNEVFQAAENFHHWTNDSRLLKKYYEESGENANWLEGLGVKFGRIAKLGNNKFETWHTYEGGAQAFIHVLADTCHQLGGDILLETKGTELLLQDGKIAGIRAQQKNQRMIIHAPVVILATGGYADNPDMIRKLAKIDPATIADTGVPGRTGDGIQMALAIGASDRRLKGSLMVYGSAMKGVNKNANGKANPLYALARLPGMKVNQQGERFMDESLHFRDWGDAGNIQKQVGIAYMILSQRTIDQFRTSGVPGSASQTKMLQDPEFLPLFEKALTKENPHVFKAVSLAELAGKIGIDVNALQASVDRYNGFCQSGQDTDYGNKLLFPVNEGPYYAFKCETGIFSTFDGLEVTENAQVIDQNGRVIPGLYAGGSDAGGVNGESYEIGIVPGSQQGWAVASGRFAARDAFRYIKVEGEKQ